MTPNAKLGTPPQVKNNLFAGMFDSLFPCIFTFTHLTNKTKLFACVDEDDACSVSAGSAECNCLPGYSGSPCQG